MRGQFGVYLILGLTLTLSLGSAASSSDTIVKEENGNVYGQQQAHQKNSDSQHSLQAKLSPSNQNQHEHNNKNDSEPGSEKDRSAMTEVLGFVAKEVGKAILGNSGSSHSQLGGGGIGGGGIGSGGGGGFRETLSSIAQSIVGTRRPGAQEQHLGGGGPGSGSGPGLLGGGPAAGHQRPPIDQRPPHEPNHQGGHGQQEGGFLGGPQNRPPFQQQDNNYGGGSHRNPMGAGNHNSGILSQGPLSRPNSQNSLFQGAQNSGFNGAGHRPSSMNQGFENGASNNNPGYEREPFRPQHIQNNHHGAGRNPNRENGSNQEGSPWRQENKQDMRDTIIRE